MKRLSLIGSWKRIGVQAGLLAGIGLAFVGGSQPPEAVADPPPGCKAEGMCTFKKPLFMIILDYSTSMNADFMGQGTRWENAVTAVKTAVDSDNGFIVSNFILGLMRFGHDPAPGVMGTPIPNDNSGIIDGQKIDVEFYDSNAPNNPYYECSQGDAIKDALDALPPPINGNLVGIGTWTSGALAKARTYFDQTLADHPSDGNPMTLRLRSILLLTDGEWTDPSGTMKLMPANANPAIVATDLFDNDDIPTYVVAIGEAMGKMFADELAAAGGTGSAYDAANPQALVDALKMVVQDLIAQQIKPICTPGLPRIMVLLDASSSMLNLQMGLARAKMGQGGWEQARDALAGADSIFDVMVQNGEVQDLVHLGLAVFGGNMPDESEILVQYGPCHKDNFGWALDPANSCGNGCNDPYADAPITWTFQDGQNVPPNFDEPTLSHMPLCNMGTQPNKGCFGSGTFTHLGLVTIQQNITAYKAECSMPNADQPCDNGTQFINIVITDGQTNSMANQYNPPLMQMNAAGIKTYVIGFGDGVDSPQAIASMNDMAMNGGTGMYYDAQNQAALEAALADIIEGVNFDPCCGFNSCDLIPEPTTIEPDPLPGSTSNVDTGDDTTTTGVDPSTSTGPNTETGVGPTTDPNTESTAGPTTQEPDPTTDTTPPTSTTTPEPDPSTTNPTENTTPPVTTQEPDPAPAETESEGGSDETGSGATAGPDDEGCGCATDPNPAKGLLGTFLTFGLAGFIRRRRR